LVNDYIPFFKNQIEVSFSEKVNAERVGVGNVSHSIGKNLNPAQVKFTSQSIN